MSLSGLSTGGTVTICGGARSSLPAGRSQVIYSQAPAFGQARRAQGAVILGRVLQIATVGRDLVPVMVGVREFPVTKLILLFEERDADVVIDLVNKLAPLKIEVDRRAIRGAPLTEVLTIMAQIVQTEVVNYDDIIVNVSGGDKLLSCSALSAAFVNGLRAIAVTDSHPVQLPVLKFSYSEMISESKMNILRALHKGGGAVESLNDLSEMSGVEKSLLSYHIRGGRDAKGLEELNLVTIERAKQGRLQVRLTEMGRLLLLGGQQQLPAKTVRVA